jgi:bifunctional non-homologous end joining protein LigD
MLATSGNLPTDPEHYTFEYKWDGVRAICICDPAAEPAKRFKLLSRNELDITRRYPELHSLGEAIGDRSAILDGEIVSLDDVGRPSFARLQHRIHQNDLSVITRLSEIEPVFYVVFDLLFLDGKSLMNEPYTKRRGQLEQLTLLGSHWQVTPAHVGEGKAMLAAARQNHLEGLVAKRLDSVYLPGKRSPAWQKIKIVQRQEFVIAGWVPERTGLPNRIGAVLVGVHDCDGKLIYAGKVGTGLSAADHAPLLKKLAPFETTKNPFAGATLGEVPRNAKFTRRALVAEIEYRRWPASGIIQHAAFKGLRTDKSPKDVVKEPLAKEANYQSR